MSLKCYFRYPDGHYCNCWAKKGSRFCGNHHAPSFATTSRDKRMHPHARLATPDDVMQLVRESLNAVRFGSMTPGQAVAINRLVESWLKLFARSCAYNREAALRTEILPSLIDADAAAEAERAKSKLSSPLQPDDPEPLEFDAVGQPDPDADPLPAQPPFPHPDALQCPDSDGLHQSPNLRPASAPATQQPAPSHPYLPYASADDPLADYGPVTPNLAIRRALDAMCAPPLPTTPDPPDSQRQLDPDPVPDPATANDSATATAHLHADAQPPHSHAEAPASASTVPQPSPSQPEAPASASIAPQPSPSQPEAPASASTAPSNPAASRELFERVFDALTASLAKGRPNGRPRDK
ncbi:MAG: hypothetical protein L0Z50_38970 [Verrucomicrobiales bacterium]|nr:hypothetical protein [Verrucomicrobiales bacterium]